MIDSILAWVSLYGTAVLIIAMITGQIGIPVPTTLILLSLGALLVDGAMSPITLFFAGLLGAVAGDQVAYTVGRIGGAPFKRKLEGSRWEHLLERAERYSDRWGSPGVFLSRWLVSPIGPYVNYVAGMSSMPWYRFTIMSILGEALWIVIFLSLGAFFSKSIVIIDQLVANTTWFIGAAGVAIFLGFQLKKAMARNHKND